MKDKEERRELYALALEGIALKIEKKCTFIAETRASYNNIKELNKLIRQFFEIREKWNAIPYDEA